MSSFLSSLFPYLFTPPSSLLSTPNTIYIFPFSILEATFLHRPLLPHLPLPHYVSLCYLLSFLSPSLSLTLFLFTSFPFLISLRILNPHFPSLPHSFLISLCSLIRFTFHLCSPSLSASHSSVVFFHFPSLRSCLIPVSDLTVSFVFLLPFDPFPYIPFLFPFPSFPFLYTLIPSHPSACRYFHYLSSHINFVITFVHTGSVFHLISLILHLI